MADSSLRCPQCGAPARTTRTCGSCGALYPWAQAPGPNDAPGRAGVDGGEAEAAERASRFRALVEHPATAQALAAGYAERREPRSRTAPILFLVLLVFLVLDATQREEADASRLPIYVAFGVLFLVTAVRSRRRRRREPVHGSPALVAEDRSRELAEDEEDDSGRLLVLEYEDGRRELVRSRSGVATRVEEGDMGVAFVAGSELLDFTRVTV